MRLLFGRHEKTRVTGEQIRSYRSQGFLLVSGLIERHAIESAFRRLLELLPDTAADSHHQFVRDRQVLACFSRRVCLAAQQLAGSRDVFKPPSVTYTVSVFPTENPWEWPLPHIDHSREEDAHLTFPPPFRIGCLIYLSDAAPHCGGTVVWPGSHLQLARLAAGSGEKYRYMAQLNRDIGKLTLQQPIEITAAAGDVLFYHYLLAHSGSTNTGNRPRLALNHKW